MKCPICNKELINRRGARYDSMFIERDRCPVGHFSMSYSRNIIRYRIGEKEINFYRSEIDNNIQHIRTQLDKLIRQYKQPQKVRRLK